MLTTLRREYLDGLLESIHVYGDVLDIGGKKIKKRGRFRPPTDGITSWRYVNIDAATAPDFRCDAGSIPLPDASVDCVLLCEVLEHLQQPENALAEAARLLKPGGRIILSMPFLYPVHADPLDYQRWTASRFHEALPRLGYASSVAVEPMGGVVAVIFDLQVTTALRARRSLLRSIAVRALACIRPLMRWLDRRTATATRTTSTTGYFVIATKRSIA
jgi:SAM-dependent methyltransferase